MEKSSWNRESCNPGRSYMLGKDLVVKSEDIQADINSIKEKLREFVYIGPAVRLVLDSPRSNSVQTILALPYISESEQVLENFAQLVHQSLMAYRFLGEQENKHLIVSESEREDQLDRLLRREMEQVITHCRNRKDLAGYLFNDIRIEGEKVLPEANESFLEEDISEVIRSGMDIHVGYRIFIRDKNVHTTRAFIPLSGGQDIINCIYANLELMLHRKFIAYDENGNGDFDITDSLIFKDLEIILELAKERPTIRKKLLNNLLVNFFAADQKEEEEFMTDIFYDSLATKDELSEITAQSKDLYISYNERITEMNTGLPGKTKITKKKKVRRKLTKKKPEQMTAEVEVEVEVEENPSETPVFELKKEGLQELK
ncbi:MAG: hypothetical protein COB67_09260 [SAR324 cluster bacterium]|uniref:Uncharacterized protein n=1 Tax=SAR324 cluster bacterium TaxID=2024889 RepID=A0A2A4T1V1_9DELT|nr:MAG: hypothetical protein COB67_09260 [SAR324 cluster bacterium]